jgi:hypothetical protein
VFLAAAVMIGGIFLATATMGTGTSVALIPSAYADANCDKAGVEIKEKGQVTGNAKQCNRGITPFDNEGEQPRSCRGPNMLKDNDGDGTAFCMNRGFFP